MSQYQHINPSHGTKNTTDPAAQNDPKREFSGTVLKDSLAAESIRSGGSFSKGNPTGIYDTTAASTTLNRGDDTEGFRKVHDSEDVSSGFGKQDEGQVRYETLGTGRIRNREMQAGSDDSYEYGQSGEKDGRSMRSENRDSEFGGTNYVRGQPEIGSDEDPGRFAEKKFVSRNARLGGTGGMPGWTGDGSRENPYDILEGERGV
ncbi:hypothetical protein ABW19_dt0201879 [Dactylella cylindrospora]|nr:hypothetical protein ABW19_dt0201879 [Dactylella cylindrospora]